MWEFLFVVYAPVYRGSKKADESSHEMGFFCVRIKIIIRLQDECGRSHICAVCLVA